MSMFVIDAAGDKNLINSSTLHNASVSDASQWRTLDDTTPRITLVKATEDTSYEPEDFEEEDDGDYFGLPPPNIDITHIIKGEYRESAEQKSQFEEDLDFVTNLVDLVLKPGAKKLKRRDNSDLDELTGKLIDEEDDLGKTDVDKELKTSRLVEDYGRLKELPDISKKKQRDINRVERSKTKGPGWYNLPATEQTEEATNELKILQMRSVLDPKHFYKKNDLKVLPKYFQIGTVQHSPLDYYSERGTRHKKRSLVDDLLQDEAAQSYTKRKFKEVVARREKYAHRKAMQKMKKLKKNK